MAVDGPALLGTAVRAACVAKAPRRTIQAVAATVAGALCRTCPSSATPAPSVRKPPCEVSTTRDEAMDPSDLVEALRASRRAKRKRKSTDGEMPVLAYQKSRVRQKTDGGGRAAGASHAAVTGKRCCKRGLTCIRGMAAREERG